MRPSPKRGLWLVLLLAGCASLPPTTSAPPIKQAVIASFQLSGRISVRHDNQAFSGNLNWRHTATEDNFLLLSPLGQGVARITRDATGVRLQTSDGKISQASDAEHLTQQALGFALPLSGLAHWAQAQAQTADAQIRYAADGKIEKISEQGWQIEYFAYRAEAGYQLPTKIYMEGAGISLRLGIDSWQVPAP